jgi:hypothetical protein
MTTSGPTVRSLMLRPTHNFRAAIAARAFATTLAAALLLGATTSVALSAAVRVAGCSAYRTRGLSVSAIKRSSAISCSAVRKLIDGTYHIGPERPYHSVRDPSGAGRPILEFRDGWRCATGAGGIACWSVAHSRWNVIVNGGTQPLAISADSASGQFGSWCDVDW